MGRSCINIGGNTTQGNNLGGGAGLFAGKVGSGTLNFKSLQGLGGLTITNDSDSIYLSASTSGGGSSYTFSNGLTEAGGIACLGGTLSTNTTINTSSHNLAITNLPTGARLGTVYIDSSDNLYSGTTMGGINSQIQYNDNGLPGGASQCYDDVLDSFTFFGDRPSSDSLINIGVREDFAYQNCFDVINFGYNLYGQPYGADRFVVSHEGYGQITMKIGCVLPVDDGYFGCGGLSIGNKDDMAESATIWNPNFNNKVCKWSACDFQIPLEIDRVNYASVHNQVNVNQCVELVRSYGSFPSRFVIPSTGSGGNGYIRILARVRQSITVGNQDFSVCEICGYLNNDSVKFEFLGCVGNTIFECTPGSYTIHVSTDAVNKVLSINACNTHPSNCTSLASAFVEFVGH